MNNKNDLLKSLNEDEFISGIFIGVTLITIIGDEFVRKYYKNDDLKEFIKAKKLFILGLVVTLIIYLIFVKKNKINLESRIKNNRETFPARIRLFGSLLLVIGTICLIFFQINDDSITNGPLI